MEYKQPAAEISLLFLNQTSETDAGFSVLVGVAVFPVLFGLVFGLARFVTDFSAELRYLNLEIGRTEGEERSHYIRQRRRLWLSLIPFMRY